MLDRVLRRNDEEGLRELVALAVDRHGSFIHRLEQRGLGAGRRAVDLVDQHDVSEEGAGDELERPVLLVVDRGAGDVRGQQVRSRLDPLERPPTESSDRAPEHRLPDPGNVLDQ